MTVGDLCYRDRDGVAHLGLPHRVRLTDGSTRTDASQWFADEAVRDETGWSESTLTQIASTISVPADATLIVVGKDNPINLTENESIYVTASAANDLVVDCNWKELS